MHRKEHNKKMSCSAAKAPKGMKKEEQKEHEKKHKEEHKKQMDKKIKSLEKTTSKLLKGEKSLLKEDHKRDKACDLGKKMMKKKSKQCYKEFESSHPFRFFFFGLQVKINGKDFNGPYHLFFQQFSQCKL